MVIHIAQPWRAQIDSFLSIRGENVQKYLSSLLTGGIELQRGCLVVLQQVWYPGWEWLTPELLLMQCPPLHWEPVIPLGWEIASSLPGKSNDPIAGLLKSDRFPGTILEQINLGNCWYLWFNRSYFFPCFSHWVYGAHYHFIWGLPSAWCFQVQSCSVEKPLQNRPTGFVFILELELEGVWPSWCRNELCASPLCLEGTRAVSKLSLFLINKFSSLSLLFFSVWFFWFFFFLCFVWVFYMRKQTRGKPNHSFHCDEWAELSLPQPWS